jgi:hypothetical protein
LIRSFASIDPDVSFGGLRARPDVLSNTTESLSRSDRRTFGGSDRWPTLWDPAQSAVEGPDHCRWGGPADEFYYGIYGVFSNLGVILWCVAATVSLFSLSVYTHASPQTKSFLLYSGILGVILTLDDLLVVHENFGSVPVYIFYAFAIAFYL